MDVVTVIFPVFAIAVLGYVLTAVGLFRTDDVGGLTRYVFNIAMPIMLFDSMSSVTLPQSIRWSFLLAYYLPTLLVFAIGLFLGRRLFQHTRTEQGIFAMGGAYSNTVLIGLPVVATAWGDSAVLPLMMIIFLHSAILFSLTTAVAESGRMNNATPGHGKGYIVLFARTALGMAKNPIFLGLVIGIMFNLASISFPQSLQTALTWIRQSALPAALFVTGASLRQYRVMGHLAEAGTLIVLKLVVHPVIVWFALTFLFDIPPLWASVATLTAALPTGVNASIFAGNYNAVIAPIATATLVSTILSIASLSVLLVLFGPV